MRCFLFLIGLFILQNANAQTGGVFVKCINELSGEPVNLCLKIELDSLDLLNHCASDDGIIRFENLPSGLNVLSLEYEGKAAKRNDTEAIVAQEF